MTRGSSPAKAAPSTSSPARNSSAMSSRARSSSSTRTACARSSPFVAEGPPRLLHLRVRLLRAARQHARGRQRQRGAHQHGPRAGPAPSRSRPIWSFPCPTPATTPRSASARNRAFPTTHAFVRNHYVGRTFLNPSQLAREFGVKVKLNIIKERVAGKRVVVVDDSIVRGTTARSRVMNLRNAGAKEVHIRISCPPHRFPCHYGIDFPDPKDLIANQLSHEEITKYLQADSLGYLDEAGMVRATGRGENKFCMACFNQQVSGRGESGARQARLRAPPRARRFARLRARNPRRGCSTGRFDHAAIGSGSGFQSGSTRGCASRPSRKWIAIFRARRAKSSQPNPSARRHGPWSSQAARIAVRRSI